MTTVAWDGKSLAADTLVTEGNVISFYEQKIRRINFGYVAGAGGNNDINAFMDWCERGCPSDDEPVLSRETMQGILVLEDGTVYEYCNKLNESKLPPGKYAWGSGSDMALATMRLGKTAAEAVQFAIDNTTDSGGDVTAFHVIP